MFRLQMYFVVFVAFLILVTVTPVFLWADTENFSNWFLLQVMQLQQYCDTWFSWNFKAFSRGWQNGVFVSLCVRPLVEANLDEKRREKSRQQQQGSDTSTFLATMWFCLVQLVLKKRSFAADKGSKCAWRIQQRGTKPQNTDDLAISNLLWEDCVSSQWQPLQKTFRLKALLEPEIISSSLIIQEYISVGSILVHACYFPMQQSSIVLMSVTITILLPSLCAIYLQLWPSCLPSVISTRLRLICNWECAPGECWRFVSLQPEGSKDASCYCWSHYKPMSEMELGI